MDPITLDFSEKEVSVIELMIPTLSAQDVCRKVMRDWFNTNVDTFYKTIKTQETVLDEIIDAKADKAVESEPPV